MTTQGTGTVELRMLPAGELKGVGYPARPLHAEHDGVAAGLLHAGVLAGVNSCAPGHGAGGPTQGRTRQERSWLHMDITMAVTSCALHDGP